MSYLAKEISHLASVNSYSTTSQWPLEVFVWIIVIITLYVMMSGIYTIVHENKPIKAKYGYLTILGIAIMALCSGLIIATMSIKDSSLYQSKTTLNKKITKSLLLSNTSIIYPKTSNYNIVYHKTKTSIDYYYNPSKVYLSSNLSYDNNGSQKIGYIKNNAFIPTNITGKQYLALMNSVYEITDNNKPSYLRITNDLNLNLIAHMRFNNQAYIITVGRTDVMKVTVSQY